MKKLINILVISGIVCVILIVIGFIVWNLPIVQQQYCIFREFVDPNIRQRIGVEWENKSARFLIGKLKSNSDIYAGVAYEILVKRKAKEAVPVFLKMLKSKNEGERASAMVALAKIGGSENIEKVMDIVRSGINSNGYVDALAALAMIKHEPVIPFVLELGKCKQNDKCYKDRSIIISIARDFYSREFLPVLEEMAKSDPEPLYCRMAQDAIAEIKEYSEKTKQKENK